jgi:tetratricopeptide (TPR) repeat protein
MNRDVSPSPEPDPRRLSLESLEEKLRALPPAEVPENLQSNLIAHIPSIKAVSPRGSNVTGRWPWIGAIGVMCIAVPAVVYSWLTHTNSKPPTGSNENQGTAVASADGKDRPATSKAIREYEQAVHFDPYNADAWFNLAKAQADVHRSADAMSSAQKAIDIARSRNRADFVDTVETWLRSYRASETRRPPP